MVIGGLRLFGWISGGRPKVPDVKVRAVWRSPGDIPTDLEDPLVSPEPSWLTSARICNCNIKDYNDLIVLVAVQYHAHVNAPVTGTPQSGATDCCDLVRKGGLFWLFHI